MAAPTTTVPDAVNTTQALELASFQEYNFTDYEVFDIGMQYHPLTYTLTAMWRDIKQNMKQAWLNEGKTDNFPEYKWDERDEYNDKYSVNWEINSSTTTLVLDSTAWLYAHYILLIPSTWERIRITSVDSATNLTIQRSVWETSAATIPDNEVMITIATASADWVSSEWAFFVANQQKSNYIQKIITTVSQTDFDRLWYKVWNYEETLMSEKLWQNAKQKEKVVMFWEKSSKTDPTTWKTFYTMWWVIPHCLDWYLSDISWGLTSDTLEEQLEYPLKYGSPNKSKIILASSKAIRAIKWLYKDNLIYNEQIEEVNLKFRKIMLNNWNFTFLEHPFLDSDSWYDDYIFIVDPSQLKFIYPVAKNKGWVNFWVEGKTQFVIDPTKTNYTSAEWSYYTYMTLERKNARAFAAIKIL